MADYNYSVKTADLDSAAQKIGTIIQDYGRHYEELFGTIKGVENSNMGDDIKALIDKVTPYRKQFEEMKQALESFKTHLEKASADYKETELGNKNRVGNI